MERAVKEAKRAVRNGSKKEEERRRRFSDEEIMVLIKDEVGVVETRMEEIGERWEQKVTQIEENLESKHSTLILDTAHHL